MEENATTATRGARPAPGIAALKGACEIFGQESVPDERIPALLEGAFAVPPIRTGRGSRAGYAVCRLCRGPAGEGRESCWSCRLVCSQLGGRAPRVVPLFLFSLGSAVHNSLVGYKAAPSCAGRSARRAALEMVVSGFFEAHLRCVVGSSCRSALIVPVPSTIGGRPSWGGRHPVGCLAEAVLGRLADFGGGGVDLRLAEVLQASAVPPARLKASARGFEVLPGAIEFLRGATVLVLDDVFTSGARALSAAAALSRAGAAVAAVVPIGRLVRPEHSPATAAFSSDWSGITWQPGRCAACRGAGVALPCLGAAAVVARVAA